MALNCPINAQGQPNKVEGEVLIVYRDHVEMEVKMEGVGKRIGKGRVRSKLFRCFCLISVWCLSTKSTKPKTSSPSTSPSNICTNKTLRCRFSDPPI